MKKVKLLFGVHMHQPVDNLGEAVDKAIELCYAPFFKTMRKYSDFKFAVHSSGWLLNEIKTKHQKIFEDILFLTKKGSIEWVGAGYYEPVLSSIPSIDRKAQINKLSSYLKKNLKSTPKGAWLTERVWESSLIPDLASCGLEYVMVDDYHFLSSGYDAKNMDGYYKSEEGAETIALFPISAALRYAIPFFSVERSIEAILSLYKNDESAAIIFDDMEKFGLWPKTHEWVYEKGWLERFLEAVLADERIEPMHYKEYLATHRSKGLAYLNNTSYFEMGEWSLASRQSLALESLKKRVGDDYFKNEGIALIKGGIWKNFFIKYHESNHIHKRMLQHSKNQESLKKSALESLYKLQTNDVLWHGVFGGLYLPNLRDNAYKYLLEIEASEIKSKPELSFLDIDMDGYGELKVLTKDLSMVFSSKYGGGLAEFGSLDALFNWQNTLMRRHEAYHEKILHPILKNNDGDKDEISTIHADQYRIDKDLKHELIYDWHPKYSFIDHLCLDEFSLESFKDANYREVGDFANMPFEFNMKTTEFKREGGVYTDRMYKTSVSKKYSFEGAKLDAKLSVRSDFSHKLRYGAEFNLHFAHPKDILVNGEKVNDGIVLKDIKEVVFIDGFTQKALKISINKKSTMYAYMLKTLSQNENGFELVTQQISIVLSMEFTKSLDLNLSLEVCNV